MDRVAIFVDGSNLYHALKRTFGRTDLRYDAFAEALTQRCSDRKLVRMYYYQAACDQIADSDRYKRQQRFLANLRRTQYLQLKLGRLERRPSEIELSADEQLRVESVLGRPLPQYAYVEKGVDVQLAVDMLHYAVTNTYDVAILVSGDGDFAPAVDAVKQLGKHVELGRVQGWPCNQLLDACDIEIAIDEAFLADCWL